MTEESIAAVRAEVRAVAADLRARALDVDAHPAAVARHLDSPGLRAVHRISTVPERPEPDRCRRLTAATLEAARGDAGVLLAGPGPSLAGVVVDLLADDAQRARFRSALADGRSWAFCAITEPQGGSDVLALRTELARTPDGLRLSGAKTYVGNASRGRLGVVLARTGPTPLHLRAVLVRADAGGVAAAALPMAGLRGGRIGRLTFTGVPVAPEDVLGSHLPPSRRGLWGVIRAFASVRVQVAAMATATAAAVCDYLTEHGTRSTPAELDPVRARIEATERLVLEAAAAVDRDEGRGQLSALAKLTATRLAIGVTTRLPARLGPGALLDHPLLEKWRRDAAGFEFMEGTSAMQLLHVADGALRDPRHRIAPDGAAA
ncbi:acyl-CoA dehydrogenase family protein [Nakamurella sp.]|uniref:acyl-CoA dehydrogenase family protein n=1 Tax=Nakamurella sp. TaxID=1869182 RepID=UPI003B3BA590